MVEYSTGKRDIWVDTRQGYFEHPAKVIRVLFASHRKQFEEVSKENKELQQARDKLNEAYAQVSHVFFVT